MKSFKQYLKEYASTVRNKEDDTEGYDDQELADDLSQSGEGVKAVLDGMIQGGVLPEPRQFPLKRNWSKERVDDARAEIAGIPVDTSGEEQEKRMQTIRRRTFDKVNRDFDRQRKATGKTDSVSQKDRTETIKWHLELADAADLIPKNMDDLGNIVPQKGKDQEMLDTISRSEDGSAFLSAARAGGLAFDAKWPVDVDWYDRVQQRTRNIMDGK